jgi:cobalt-precorrin 5A hydrolase / precorrin-3B C17-methyltransferase
MPLTPSRVVGFALSKEAIPLLQRLQQAGWLGEIRWPDDPISPADWLAREWPLASAVVAVAASGLVTRLVAPLLVSKATDPAVVVLDPEGRFAVPLLGGHGAGAEALARQIAALLGGQAVITGSSSAAGRLALDSFGTDWGWMRGTGDWQALMLAARQDLDRVPLRVRQESGTALWHGTEAAQAMGLRLQKGPAPDPDGKDPDLVIGPRLGSGCRWHPPSLWLGMGCERDTSLSVLDRLVEETLQRHGLAIQAVAGLATVDRKADEPALRILVERYGWRLVCFSAPVLAEVPVPNPSRVVEQEMGTASVAEAAALLAAAGGDGTGATLVVPKTVARAGAGEKGAATLAVAEAGEQWGPARGELHLVGSGPGSLDLLTGDGRWALARCGVWAGYSLYLDLLEPLRRPDQLRRDGRLTEERARCGEALALAAQGLQVALISSGESGIYGMAGLALEQWLDLPVIERPLFQVHPGISALQLAAARAGAPLMHDFCTISLSDRLTPWPVIEDRLRGAAAGDFVVALYNPRSKGRDWQLGRALDLLMEQRQPTTPVLIARQLGRHGEGLTLTTLDNVAMAEVDMLTLLLVGNSTSYVKDGRFVTPRGYPGAELG